MLLKLLLGAVLFAVAAPILLAAACGRSLLYHPTRLSASEYDVLGRQAGWNPQALSRDGQPTLRGLVRPGDGAVWLLFFGGNAMGLNAGQSILQRVAGESAWGLAVWAYRGYDGSEGNPTEPNLHADALAQIDLLEAQHGARPGQIILLGQSLGTGIAAALAATLGERGTPPAGLVLMSPYTSMAQVFDDQVPLIPVGWAAADTYRTEKVLPQVHPPVLILHGADDTLIGVEHGRAVATALGDRVRYVELDGRGHNDLWEDARTTLAIRELVSQATADPTATQ